MPGFVFVLGLALLVSMPLKTFVKNNAGELGPLTASAAMLVSFAAFLLVFFAFVGPTIILWNHYKNRAATVPKPKQVPYGYHTPVPR